MAGLIGVWRAIGRAIGVRHSADTVDSSISHTNEGHRYGKLLPALQTGGTCLWAFFRSIGQRMEQARLRRAEVWLEATQNEATVRKERRAKRRALSLLMRLLNLEQRQEFREYRHFHVIGAGSGDRYRIRMEMIANIDVLDENGKTKHRLCVHSAGEVPLYDVMASQLLHLQDPVAEKRLLQQANVVPALTEVRSYSRATMLA